MEKFQELLNKKMDEYRKIYPEDKEYKFGHNGRGGNKNKKSTQEKVQSDEDDEY